MTQGRPLPRGLLERLAPWVLAGVALLLVLRLLARAHHGFEFTDEGYYLAWLADPSLYAQSASQFGFVYHPLYVAFDGDIVSLRQVNLGLSAALAWACYAVLLGPLFSSPRLAALLAIAFAPVGLLLFFVWLPTPGYNSLALQGLWLVATGLLLATRTPDRRPGWVVLALGGALLFLAKPPAAVFAGVAALLGLGLAGALRPRGLALTSALGVLLLGALALAIDGGPFAFATRLEAGAHQMHLLGGGYDIASLLRWDEFDLTPAEIGTFWVLLLAAATTGRPNAARLHAATALLLAVAAAAWLWREPPLAVTTGPFAPLLLAALAIAAATARVLQGGGVPRAAAGAALGLALLPFAFAFGSNNNYWLVAQHGAGCWLAAGLCLLARSAPDARSAAPLLPLAGATLLLTTGLLVLAMQHPYRQPLPLAAQQEPVTLGAQRARLRVAPSWAAYLRGLDAGARAAGFAPGTAALDFSGQSPGVLHALGARQIGLPWWAGGYPGSDALAAQALDRLDCRTLASAWVLDEPGGPRALSPALAERFGTRLPADYTIVAEVSTPAGAGDYAEPRRQRLLRPVREVAAATAACRTARAGAVSPARVN